MTKKAGILTFHKTVNYGAMLQTYALQKYINDKAVDCEVIDYQNPQLEKIERPLKLFRQRTLKGIIKYIKCHRYQVRKWDRFEKFRLENVRISNTVYTKENLCDIDSEYDAVIVGSDQVWNTEITDNDYTYFLDFLKDNNKKLSYAASFGFEKIPDCAKDSVSRLLPEFKTVTVREAQAKVIADSIIGSDSAHVVIDPTLLLSKQQWQVFADPDRFKDCIVVYMIDFCKEVFDFIRTLAKDTGCKIVYVHDAIRSQAGMINSRDDTVEDFISMLNNARYVVTGSFHALCMSLVLEKQFFYTLNSKSNKNSRLENLIFLAGLEHRKVVNGKCDADTSIDYTAVKSRLDPVIFKSKEILDNMLEEF